MFWSKKKIDDDKDKQIRDLKSVFPSIRRPNNDDTLFELKFVVDNQYSSLRIFIPADFPMTRPGKRVPFDMDSFYASNSFAGCWPGYPSMVGSVQTSKWL